MTRFALVLAALLPLAASAQAAPEAHFSLDLDAGHTAWRVALSDAQYAALTTADFSDVQVVDGAGAPLDWALCMRTRAQTRRAVVPVTPVPVAGRAQLDVDGRVTLLTGAGFRAGEFGSLVLDTRGHGAVGGITVPGWQGRSVTVRASPDLRQWSNRLPVSARAAGDALRLELSPIPANFVRIDADAGFTAAPEGVVVDFEDEGVRVETAWYAPPSLGPGVVRHVRALPVRAARVAPGERLRWTLQSRDRDGNPWKPRATGVGADPVEFSALYDGFWRVQPELPGLELGHAAYELRIAGVGRLARATLIAGTVVRSGARLSCDLERWDSAGTARFVTGAAPGRQGDRVVDSPTNFSSAFLVIVGLIAAAWVGVRLIIRRTRL